MNALMIANTQIRCDVNNRYCLNDLHQASGGENRKRPQFWLELEHTKELIQILRDECAVPKAGNPALGEPVEVVHGGFVRGTYAVKELVYSYAMWISPKFHLHVINAYDAMITGAHAVSTPVLPDAATHRADVVVSASRSFSALVRAGRTMGLHRDRAVASANAATRRMTGIDLADELGVSDQIQAATAQLMQLDALDPALAVARFHQSLQSGDIPLPYVPCMSREAFYAYQHWCLGAGETALTLPRFVQQLTKSQGVKLERKRYRADRATFGPAAVLLWGYAKPANQTEPAYLGQTIAEFAAASTQYMLGNPDAVPPRSNSHD